MRHKPPNAKYFFSHIFMGGVVKLAITQAERLLFTHSLTLRYPDSLFGSYHRVFFLTFTSSRREPFTHETQKSTDKVYIFSHIVVGCWLISHCTSGTTVFYAL